MIVQLEGRGCEIGDASPGSRETREGTLLQWKTAQVPGGRGPRAGAISGSNGASTRCIRSASSPEAICRLGAINLGASRILAGCRRLFAAAGFHRNSSTGRFGPHDA